MQAHKVDRRNDIDIIADLDLQDIEIEIEIEIETESLDPEVDQDEGGNYLYKQNLKNIKYT